VKKKKPFSIHLPFGTGGYIDIDLCYSFSLKGEPSVLDYCCHPSLKLLQLLLFYFLRSVRSAYQSKGQAPQIYTGQQQCSLFFLYSFPHSLYHFLTATRHLNFHRMSCFSYYSWVTFLHLQNYRLCAKILPFSHKMSLHIYSYLTPFAILLSFFSVSYSKNPPSSSSYLFPPEITLYSQRTFLLNDVYSFSRLLVNLQGCLHLQICRVPENLCG